RNFITASRASKDFLLSPEDLVGLRVTTRRSPNEHDPPLNVYWRKDVSAKSIQKWGSIQSLENALETRLQEEEERSKSRSRFLSAISKMMKTRQAEKKTLSRQNWPVRSIRRPQDGLSGQSGQVVLIAIGINTANFLLKVGAWIASEATPYTCNQIILAYGIHKSVGSPTVGHPYGYSNMQYVSSLISGTGIFCLGAGLSIYHGISAEQSTHRRSRFIHFFYIRGPLKSLPLAWIWGYDPSVNVVLLEDVVAVSGVAIAAGAMTLSVKLGSHVLTPLDPLQSRATGVYRELYDSLQYQCPYWALHTGCSGIDMGNGFVRYKAELDIDGRELTRIYLNKNDLGGLLSELYVEAWRGDCGLFGEQVDRIERNIRKEHPEVRHMDLEVL
ncbi:Zinc transporter, partial [Caligus rogercresseyi]